MLTPNLRAIETGRVALVLLSGCAMFFFGVLVGAGVMASITDTPSTSEQPSDGLNWRFSPDTDSVVGG